MYSISNNEYGKDGRSAGTKCKRCYCDAITAMHGGDQEGATVQGTNEERTVLSQSLATDGGVTNQAIQLGTTSGRRIICRKEFCEGRNDCIVYG